MNIRLKTTTLSALVLALFAVTSATAQEVIRTPDGKPDFSGIWQSMTSAHYNVEPHAAEEGPHPREMGAWSAIPAGLGVVEGGKIPYTTAGLAKRNANKADAINLDPVTKCFMPGVPRANMMPFPFQIVQSREVILIAHEFAESNRIVYVDQPELESQVDSWMGHSNAHWEGDTLVVRVSGQMEDSWLDAAGNHHSWEMVVEERWSPMSANVINYQATITDPQTFTEPWTVSFPIYRHLDENMQLLEFKCVEFAEEFMYGEFRKPGSPRD